MSRARRGITGLALVLAGLLALAGCERHSEDEARALLSGWFDLGETLYFESRRSCTAGVFRVKSMDVKSRVPAFSTAEAVVMNGKQSGAFALKDTGKTADALFIDLMNADRPTGVAIQSAGLEARPCMDEKVRNAFFSALTADPSVVVFSRPDAAFAVLDPVRGIVVLTSGGD